MLPAVELEGEPLPPSSLRPSFRWAQRVFALTLLGLLLYGFPTNAAIFLVAVAVSAVLAVMDLASFVRDETRREFSYVMAVSILAGYGLGTAIFMISERTLTATSTQYWVPQGLYYGQSGLSRALGACLFASAALYMMSVWEYKGGRRAKSLGPFSETERSNLRLGGLIVPLVLTSTVVIAVATGKLGYMGTISNVDGRVHPLGALASLIAPALAFLLVLQIRLGVRAIGRLVLLIALVFLGLVLLVMGRRYLLYGVVLGLAALFVNQSSGGVDGNRVGDRRPQVPFRALFWLPVAFAGGIALYWAFAFFLSLRMVFTRVGEDASLGAATGLAWNQLMGTQGAIVQTGLHENLGSRPYILAYFGGLADLDSDRLPTHGTELSLAVQATIPSSVSEKSGAALVPENVIHPLYGLAAFDGPNSFLVAGFDDWGLLGVVAYPIAVVFLFRLIFQLTRRIVRNSAVVYFVWAALAFQLLYIEQALAGALVAVRNLLLIVVGLHCALLVLQGRSRQPS